MERREERRREGECSATRGIERAEASGQQFTTSSGLGCGAADGILRPSLSSARSSKGERAERSKARWEEGAGEGKEQS
jgi:hypothetical protein